MVRRAVVIASAAVLLSAGVALASARIYAKEPNGNLYKPAMIEMSGDGTQYVFDLHWRSWGGKTAVATGKVMQKNCVPDCAAATPHYYPARVTLSHVAKCTNLRKTMYLTTTMVVTGAAKPVDGKRAVVKDPCRGFWTLS